MSWLAPGNWKEKMMDQVSLNMVLQKEIAVQEKELTQMLQLYQEEKE